MWTIEFVAQTVDLLGYVLLLFEFDFDVLSHSETFKIYTSFSAAVYLVAQYARSEMKRMDTELELKKQAEFEAQAKEMESKKAEERAADPVVMEVKERLNKLEETVKEIVVGSKKQSNDAETEASKVRCGLEEGKSSKVSTRTSTEEKMSEPALTTPASQHKPKSDESKKDLT